MAPTTMPQIEGDIWLNGEKPQRDTLARRVILVFFWTYTCARCLNVLPFIKSIWRGYGKLDFTLIGIHVPEFEFEKDPGLVAEALQELEVGWPVVLDNERRNWDGFAATLRPSLYLANREGRIVYASRSRELEYPNIEADIRRLLGLPPLDGAYTLLEFHEHMHGGICFLPTPDLYCGYEKGNIANPGGYVQDREATYELPTLLEDGSIALYGDFIAGPRYLEATRVGSAVHISFHATEVDMVLVPSIGGTVVEVELDEKALGAELLGRDVDDESEVTVPRPSVYNLLSSEEPVLGNLTVRAKKGRFRAYVITFSGCVD